MAITIVGLGPGGIDRTPEDARRRLLDPEARVFLRTAHHPAAEVVSATRPVETADDLYDRAERFEEVYEELARRVVTAALEGADVVFGVPGSPSIGERTVPLIRALATTKGIPVDVIRAESFLDAVLETMNVDPLEDGLQVLDGRDLPDPLVLHVPTVIAQVDVAVVLADVGARLQQVLGDSAEVTILRELSTDGVDVFAVPVGELDPAWAGLRTTLYVEPAPVGWWGVVQTMRRLRLECPWDRRQTHETLVPYLLEEAHELVEAIAHLPPGAPSGEADHGAYADVEEELGDVLLQVLFHTALAREAGAFDASDVAETLRRKLVERHPHVFGDVVVSGADEVVANWRRIKGREGGSPLDGVPTGLAGLARAAEVQRRAARVGFDWEGAGEVLAKVEEEVEELREVIDDPTRAVDEIGDLVFSAVNLARHLSVDPEVAIRRAVDRFEQRFRRMEELAAARDVTLESLDLDGLDALWNEAKAGEL